MEHNENAKLSHQPCVCIARCNHCICGALPPADADVDRHKVLSDYSLTLGRVKWALEGLIIWAEATNGVCFSQLPQHLAELNTYEIREAKKALELIDVPAILPTIEEDTP